MKLKGKILALSLIPVILLGILMFLVASDKIANGIYDEAYAGMQATALAVRDIFEQGNEGTYHIDENGDLWKGDSLNISLATSITDHIKENTGMEVTIFWGDTRILTSIVNEQGERQINTKASADVMNHVLKNGETYQNRNVEILGKKYIVCYIPIYQADSEEIVGMVFLGTQQKTVSVIINKIRGQFLLIVLCTAIFVTVFSYLLVNRIVSALKKNMDVIDHISKGMLHIDMEQSILDRKDEIGDLARNILNLRNELHDIVINIHEKSKTLNHETSKIEEISENVYQFMKEVNTSAQEIAESCATQAEGANQASVNVTTIGNMIAHNTTQINQLHGISEQMKKGTMETVAHFTTLNTVMQSVKEAIYFLSQISKTREY